MPQRHLNIQSEKLPYTFASWLTFPCFPCFLFFIIQTPLFMCSAQKFPQDAVKGGGVIKGWCGVRGEKVDG